VNAQCVNANTPNQKRLCVFLKQVETMSNIPETHYVVNDNNELVLVDDVADLEPPKMQQVVLLNDDYTPMDFVVELLIKIFDHNETTATEIMTTIHETGEAVAATYSFDVAESRIAHVNAVAQSNGFPLKAVMRPAIWRMPESSHLGNIAVIYTYDIISSTNMAMGFIDWIFHLRNSEKPI